MRSLWLSVMILAALAVPARADSPIPAVDASTAAQPAPAQAAQAPAQAPAAQVPAVRGEYRSRRPPPGPEAAAPAADDQPELPIAFGVNFPLSWGGSAYGASAYVGIGRRHALRSNLAWYKNQDLLGGGYSNYQGSITDLGLSWIWYSRDLWQGLIFEAGALRRARDAGEYDYYNDAQTDTVSATYAGRAMVGWSWLIAHRLFIAAAIGVSVGRETGTETITPNFSDRMPTTRAIDRMQVDGEAYLRVGLAFGR